VKGGQKAELLAYPRPLLNGANDYVALQWYSYGTSGLIGVESVFVPPTWTGGNFVNQGVAAALVTPSVDTEYELRVTRLSGTVTGMDVQTFASVNSTLPNASVTSQVIKKETVATNTTAWTVTLPVACKAIRVKLMLVNSTGSTNAITYAVNGVSTGDFQQFFSYNGNNTLSAESSGAALGSLSANLSVAYDIDTTVCSNNTKYYSKTLAEDATSPILIKMEGGRISQSADISSLTFTGSQTNGIGAGSYIIVERVDADLSQDLGWQDYTPTCYIDLTSATTVPNITPSVRYRVQGKTLFMQGTLNFTGAPTGATDLAISLPSGVNVVSLPAASKFPYAGHSAFTGGSGTWTGTVRLPGSTENSGRVSFRPQTSASGVTAVTTTAPFTWANGNQLEFDFFTEIQ
jgi:hypothetical protein